MPRPGPRTTPKCGDRFKATAVKLSELPGVAVQDVAESHYIHPFMRSRWRKQAREGRIVTKGIEVEKDVAAELKALHAVIAQCALLRSHWRDLCPTLEAPRLEDAWIHSTGSLTPMSPTSSGSSRLIKRRRGFVVAAALVACALKTHPVEARGPSTQEERAQFVALVRSLERDPLAENASTTRQQLREWMIEVPDITFKVCDDLLGQALGDKYSYSSELSLQAVLSGAALTMERPGEARNDIAVYTAGIEGALRAYEVLVRSRADARLAALDDLLEAQRRGELVDHVSVLAKEKCKRTNTRIIAAPIGAAVGLVLAVLVTHWFGGGLRRTSITAGVAPASASAMNAGIFRSIVLSCAAYYLIVGIALHFLEPEYDPRFYPMSHYVWGAYGWLMTTTFFVLGLAIVTVALGLRSVNLPSRSARVGFGLLIVGALFVCLAGVFKGFPLHDVASAIGLPSVAMAVLLLSLSFRKAAGWQAIGTATTLIADAMLVALLSIIVDVGMPGLQQRAFLFLLLLWLSIVAHRLVRVTVGPLQ